MPVIELVSPAPNARVRGQIALDVRVAGGAVSDVGIAIGDQASNVQQAFDAGGGVWRVMWDTTKKVGMPKQAVPGDALYWITASAQVDGRVHRTRPIPVVTANQQRTTASTAEGAGGWRKELAWHADYSGSLSTWKKSQFAVIGARHAQLLDDPVLGTQRKAIKVVLPDSAVHDSDQPKTTTVRFQSSSPRVIKEGDEFCVGFAYYPPDDFPSVYPRHDPTNPRGIDATGYLAIFQFYGPPYTQGSPLVLHAHRRTVTDPVDEINIRGNELNPGDPADFLALPYRRGRWTDVVFKIRASSSIDDGWIEVYINQGESTHVRPLTINGMTRVPRVFLRPESQEWRTDMQIYRVAGRIPIVTLWHTGHRIAQTVAAADPGSYRTGAVS